MKKLFYSLILCVAISSCSSTNQPAQDSSFVKVGSFAAYYNAETGDVEYRTVTDTQKGSSPRFLEYTDTTGVTNPDGVTGGAIRLSGDTILNYAMR